MNAVVDVDDLWNEQQITEHLVPLKEAVPGLIVTAYTIPNKMGAVHELKERYPWIVFGIHGWEHTFCEAREWTSEKAAYLLRLSLEMGYAPVFKAPNWKYDNEILPVLKELGITLHYHLKDPPPDSYDGLGYGGPHSGRVAKLQGLSGSLRRGEYMHSYVHTHIERNASTDFIADALAFQPLRLKRFDDFKTPLAYAR